MAQMNSWEMHQRIVRLEMTLKKVLAKLDGSNSDPEITLLKKMLDKEM